MKSETIKYIQSIAYLILFIAIICLGSMSADIHVIKHNPRTPQPQPPKEVKSPFEPEKKF